MEVISYLHTLADLLLGKNPGTNGILGRVSLGASLDIMKKLKIPRPYWDLNPTPSSP